MRGKDDLRSNQKHSKKKKDKNISHNSKSQSDASSYRGLSKKKKKGNKSDKLNLVSVN